MDVRAQILTSATRMFAQRGYDGTSLQTIADAVGIRKPSLLYHFPSKEALRESVLDHVIQHWNEAVPRLVSTVSSGRGRFEGLTRELVRFFEEDPDRARLILRELMDRPDDMRARLESGVRPWVELLADYIRQGQDKGGLQHDADPQAYVVHIITLALCGIAARPALAHLMTEPERGAPTEGGGGDPTHEKGDLTDRHTQELLRIARTSLFVADGRQREPKDED